MGCNGIRGLFALGGTTPRLIRHGHRGWRSLRQRQLWLLRIDAGRGGGNGHCPSLFVLVVTVPGAATLPPSRHRAPPR
ncbi:hypothetical protein [Amycolatopsis pithecellobii]|uniref:Uncharacterized protein n=1 Tax=Amycolatopsis pithecellobii TaxID=664692 RepID=A0A6N7YXJ5_9PSEU|nr:hypothetical protein [Amycolatopsis pithecellobii]MTD53593.1 hypothetical protein [Amycolatopsis pithecellobii]